MKILLNGKEIKKCFVSEIIYRITREIGFDFKVVDILRQTEDDSKNSTECIDFKADGVMCAIEYEQEDTDTEFICGKNLFKSSHIVWSFSGYGIGRNNDLLTGVSCVKNPNFDTVVKSLKNIENFKKRNSEFALPNGFGLPNGQTGFGENSGVPQGFNTNITEGKR